MGEDFRANMKRNVVFTQVGRTRETLTRNLAERRKIMKRCRAVYDKAWIAHVERHGMGHWTHAAAAGLRAVEDANVFPLVTCGVEGGTGQWGVEYLYLNTGETYDETLMAFKGGLRFGTWGGMHGV